MYRISSTERGRPTGSGKNDSDLLAQLADLLIARRGMKPATALKQLRRGISDTDLHRLGRKWRVDHEVLLQRAHDAMLKRAADSQAKATREAGQSGELTGDKSLK
jgi:hypothetical protein